METEINNSSDLSPESSSSNGTETEVSSATTIETETSTPSSSLDTGEVAVIKEDNGKGNDEIITVSPDPNSSRPKFKVLNANILKIIAIIAMTLDHLAWAIWPGFSYHPAAIILHIIGRLTCPIMCYFIAEGYFYTKNLNKYIIRMFIFAIISQFPFVYTSFNYIDPMSFIPFYHGSPFNQTSVLWGFAWGLVLIRVHDSKLKYPIKLLLTFLILGVTFPADWSCIAPMIILSFWANRNKFLKQMLWMMFWIVIYGIVYFFALDKYYALVQLGVSLSIPILFLYNGQRGKFRKVNKVLKWFFYIYYPLHLLIIGLMTYFGVFPIF